MANRDRPNGMADPAPTVRFGAFEVDLRREELRKEGRWIRLQAQPFQILRMLLESPGEVVSREKIRKRLWPDDTVVEFDHSISVAVRRLRDALQDSADKPRYIQTLSRRGYRFIGELDAANPPAPANPVAKQAADLAGNVPERDRQPEPVLRRRWFAASPRISVPVLLAVVALIIWAAAAHYGRRAQPSVAVPLQPLMRLNVDLGSGVSVGSARGADVIFSPDGTRLVYVSKSKLFTRRLDQAISTELRGTEGAQAPFFSPDGRWVAFFADGKLKKVLLESEQIVTLCDAHLFDGGSWGESGTIVAALDLFLSRVSSTGSGSVQLTELAPGEIAHRWPQVLPGGTAALFSSYASATGLDGANIEVVSFNDRRRKTLVRGGTWGRYLPGGYLVYLNKGTLFAVRFDANLLEVRGTPMPVLDNIAYSAAWGSAQIDFSRVGTLVYRSARVGTGLVTVRWLNQSGNTRPVVTVPGNYLSPTLSPDGTRLALTSTGDIWVYELGRGSMTRLTVGGGYGNPVWTGDSRYVMFRAARGMFWMRADGMGQQQPLTQSNRQQIPWSFTASGHRLSFVEVNPANRAEIWTVSVNSDGSGLRAGKPEAFLQEPFNVRSPMFSPDGRWIAYQSHESGAPQVYVQAFPDKHGKRQVSPRGGELPSWSRNGHELFFQFGQPGQLMVVSYQSRGDSFLADKPRVWTERLAGFTTTRSYDPASDGLHVFALTPAETQPKGSQDEVIILLNFFEELRRRIPSNPN